MPKVLVLDHKWLCEVFKCGLEIEGDYNPVVGSCRPLQTSDHEEKRSVYRFVEQTNQQK